MQQIGKRITKIIFTAILFFSFSTSSFASPSRNLTVFTEPNMVVALTKIAREFSQKTNTVVSVNFDLSPDLPSDIDSGEPMDVLISAHSKLIDSLKQKGLIDVHSAGYIAGDLLVLVTSNPKSELAVALRQAPSLEESLKILEQSNAELLVDHQGNSSGNFSNDLLQSLALPNLKLFNKVSEDKSSILGTARKNKVSYALLLMSQVKNEADFTVLSTKKDLNIFYQALVIAGDNMEVAREFVKFLKSNAARSILTEAGFEMLGQN